MHESQHAMSDLRKGYHSIRAFVFGEWSSTSFKPEFVWLAASSLVAFGDVEVAPSERAPSISRILDLPDDGRYSKLSSCSTVSID